MSFLPFDGEPVVQGQCLPDVLEPGYVSFKLECFGFPGGPGGTGGLGGTGGPGGPGGPGGRGPERSEDLEDLGDY